MIPTQWVANVKLPYYGWFGRDDFASEREARDFVARKLRAARRDTRPELRPHYSSRTYTVRRRVMREAF